jgi:uracil-DNA glycosylase
VPFTGWAGYLNMQRLAVASAVVNAREPDMNDLPRQADVVFVGAGHNALVATAYLLVAGRSGRNLPRALAALSLLRDGLTAALNWTRRKSPVT